MQAMHKRFHQYIPHHNFVIGVDNVIVDCPSLSRYLTDAVLLKHMDIT